MNFQWLFLALLAVFLIVSIKKALYRPALKNFLNLMCIPVAFVFTYLIQACGVFQWIAGQAIEYFNFSEQLGSLAALQDYLLAFAGTLLAPLLFVLVFFLLYFIFKLIHVRIVYKSITSHLRKKRQKELRSAIKREREQAKRAIIENEKRLANQPEEERSENIFSAAYRDLSHKEIDKLVEKRVVGDKKRRKNKNALGMPKESPECRLASIMCGALVGILILGVISMPVFYTMGLLTSAVDSIRDTDADDSVIYGLVEVVDKDIVTPYESTFTYQLYDGIGLVDLLNSSVRSAGRIGLDSGKTVYASDIMKTLLTHGISAAAQLTSQKTEYPNLEEDVKALTSNPLVASILSDAVIKYIGEVEVEEPAEGDMMNEIKYDFITYYQNANKATIEEDIGFISDGIVKLAKSGIISDLISGKDTDFETLFSDRERVADVAEAISALSVFDSIAEKLFTTAIGTVGETLGIPEDNEGAYNDFYSSLVEAMSSSNSSDVNINKVKEFIVACAESDTQLVSDCSAQMPTESAEFVKYVKIWSSVQKVFMNASEDRSLAYFTMNIDGTLYMLDMGNIENIEDVTDMRKAKIITVENEADYEDKISPMAHLIHFLSLRCSASVDNEELCNILNSYLVSEEGNENKNCKLVAIGLVNPESFTSKAVTVEALKNNLDFENWTREDKRKDSRLCVLIILDFLDISTALGDSDGSADAVLNQFVALGRVMDSMTETKCMNKLPPLLLEGVVKSGALGEIMTPAIVHQISDKIQNNDELTYEAYMQSLVDLVRLTIK